MEGTRPRAEVGPRPRTAQEGNGNDTRIMIPLRFCSTAAFEGAGGHETGHDCRRSGGGAGAFAQAKRKRLVPTSLERAGSVTCADGFYRCQPVMPLRRVIRTAVVQCLSPAEDVDRVAVALTAAALPKLSEEEPHGCKRF